MSLCPVRGQKALSILQKSPPFRFGRGTGRFPGWPPGPGSRGVFPVTCRVAFCYYCPQKDGRLIRETPFVFSLCSSCPWITWPGGIEPPGASLWGAFLLRQILLDFPCNYEEREQAVVSGSAGTPAKPGTVAPKKPMDRKKDFYSAYQEFPLCMTFVGSRYKGEVERSEWYGTQACTTAQNAKFFFTRHFILLQWN